MKRNLLALLAMALLTGLSIATSEAKSGRTAPPDEVSDGCRNVISHHVTRSGPATLQSRLLAQHCGCCKSCKFWRIETRRKNFATALFEARAQRFWSDKSQPEIGHDDQTQNSGKRVGQSENWPQPCAKYDGNEARRDPARGGCRTESGAAQQGREHLGRIAVHR